MGLFKPIWKTDNNAKVYKAVSAVRNITDQNKLLEIALTAPLEEVRTEAARGITDNGVCHTALTQLTEQSTIAALLLRMAESPSTSVNWETIRKAIGRITNQRLLEALAGKGYLDAVYRLNDPKTLYSFATDQNAIKANLSFSDKERIANAAFSRIADRESVIRAARQSPYESISRDAVRRLLSNGWLTSEDIARDATFSPDARTAAICSVTSQEILKEIAENEKNDSISRVAKSRVEDPVLRLKYCKADGIHEWEETKTDTDMCPDFNRYTSRYRCKYCGKEKTETYRL